MKVHRGYLRESPGETRTVLIVDGSAEQRRMLAYLVREQGWLVREASTGQTALDMVEKGPPHLVLLEVELGDMDGFEVCRCLRRFSNVPVIMLTSRRGEVEMVRGLDCGADDCVVKPYSPADLVARMRAVMQRSLGWPGR